MTTPSSSHIAQQVFKAVVATLPPLDVFSYSAIQSLSLSAQSRAFIFAELAFSARSLLSSLKSSRFNLQCDELREARHQFAHHIVVMATRLGREDFIKILESAIQIEAQYLARPHKILKDLIFANRAELSSRDVFDRLSNFVEYSYLLDVFKQYLERKQPNALSAEKFEKVLFEIDSKLCAAYSHDELMALFKPLFDFHQRGGEKAIACATLRLFLAEKNLIEHIKRLDLASQNGIESLTAEALNDLLSAPLELLAPKPATAMETQPAPPPSAPKVSEPADLKAPEPPRAEPKPASPPQPIASNPIESQPIEPTPFESKPIASEPTAPALAAPEIAEEKKAPAIDFFELEKQKLQSQKLQQEPALRDVRLLISDDERKKFVKRLFKGNETEYNAAIAAINQMKTWREASLFIDREIFTRFKVDEFSSEAVAFVDIVFERFQTR